MNEDIQQARVDLAAALRLAVRYGFHEGICNHFSYAVPGHDDRFLLNPYGTHWSQVGASDLLVVDGAGKVLEGDGVAEVSAFCIHAPIHQRHPHARAVLHTHMPYATALTSIEDGRLEPVTQNALRFYSDVAYDDDYNGLAHDTSEGARMAAVLGDKRVLFLAHHGVIVVGDTMAQTFDDLYYLERACEVQVLAMSTGRPLKRIGDNMAGSVFSALSAKDSSFAKAHFDALKQVLDAEDPGYAQ
jgi:ribulose-5-phosphate 4-epimerase/fuculose-1-phosphate aldolase